MQQLIEKNYEHSLNKTKDWALVQNAALVINIEVMELCQVWLPNLTYPNLT